LPVAELTPDRVVTISYWVHVFLALKDVWVLMWQAAQQSPHHWQTSSWGLVYTTIRERSSATRRHQLRLSISSRHATITVTLVSCRLITVYHQDPAHRVVGQTHAHRTGPQYNRRQQSNTARRL